MRKAPGAGTRAPAVHLCRAEVRVDRAAPAARSATGTARRCPSGGRGGGVRGASRGGRRASPRTDGRMDGQAGVGRCGGRRWARRTVPLITWRRRSTPPPPS
ncbi:hypothetical protein CP969_21650 [Streptomyces viridosporus T7A]|uniref:Uncharacterized protein n=1 Tax=Streptomyces viridosporus T7A TaxID=665577 RepID=A0ABX6AIC4_STRVD|nr:hypothetical protein CP969_21650 [Streptomyces viridosporus T7A]